MIETIGEKVGVMSVYDNVKRSFYPYKIKWQARYYTIKKVCFHHKVRNGRVVQHIFHVTDGAIDFKLVFDADALSWTLEEVCDGIAA